MSAKVHTDGTSEHGTRSGPQERESCSIDKCRYFDQIQEQSPGWLAACKLG